MADCGVAVGGVTVRKVAVSGVAVVTLEVSGVAVGGNVHLMLWQSAVLRSAVLRSAE